MLLNLLIFFLFLNLFFLHFLFIVLNLPVINLCLGLRFLFNLWDINFFNINLSSSHLLRWGFFVILVNLYRFTFTYFWLSFLFILIRQFFFRYFSSIFGVIFVSNFPYFFNCDFVRLLKLCADSNHCIIFWILNEVIDNVSCWIVGPVFNLIFCYLCEPEVVHFGISIENIHRHIRLTHLWNDCSISSISHVNSTKLSGVASYQRFCSFEWMNMILKRCHHMVLIELRNPVEKSIQETSRIAVECLADAVNRNMVVNELDFIFVCLERINHEFLLIPAIIINFTRRIRACSQNPVLSNGRFRKWN